MQGAKSVGIQRVRGIGGGEIFQIYRHIRKKRALYPCEQEIMAGKMVLEASAVGNGFRDRGKFRHPFEGLPVEKRSAAWTVSICSRVSGQAARHLLEQSETE